MGVVATIFGLLAQLGLVKIFIKHIDIQRKERREFYESILDAKRATMFHMREYLKTETPTNSDSDSDNAALAQEREIAEKWDRAAINARLISELSVVEICEKISYLFQNGLKKEHEEPIKKVIRTLSVRIGKNQVLFDLDSGEMLYFSEGKFNQNLLPSDKELTKIDNPPNQVDIVFSVNVDKSVHLMNDYILKTEKLLSKPQSYNLNELKHVELSSGNLDKVSSSIVITDKGGFDKGGFDKGGLGGSF